MPSRNRAPSLRSGAFTLVELLLAVALLALLLGAIAFNFSSLQQGQALEQGADQFESLLRIARAHSALSGHPVLVGLIPASPHASPSASANPDALALAVLAQPDPLQNPSLLTPVPGTAALLPTLAELVQLEVQFPNPSLPQPDTSPSPDPIPAPHADPTISAAATTPTNLPPHASHSIQTLVTFHPDGSANPASFTLVSLDPSDTRRLRIAFDPVSASFQRQLLAPAQDPLASQDPTPAPDFDAEPDATRTPEERP